MVLALYLYDGGSKKTPKAVSSTPRVVYERRAAPQREDEPGRPNRTVPRDLPSRRSCDLQRRDWQEPKERGKALRETTRLSGNAAISTEGIVQARPGSSVFWNIAPIAYAQPSQRGRAPHWRNSRGTRDRIRSLIHGERWLQSCCASPLKVETP